MEDKRLEATLRLLDIMDTLREKCPWDRKQTFESLRGNTIEETYELADAITDGNLEAIKEEAGDLLLHVGSMPNWGRRPERSITRDWSIRSAISSFIAIPTYMETWRPIPPIR